MDYPVIILRLSDEDGGGYLGYAPDLLGCMGDGDTPEAALADTQSAIVEWLDTAKARGIVVPEPHSQAARENKQKADLLRALKELSDGIEAIDGRLEDLTRRIEEIESAIENAGDWSRFATITGNATLIETRQLTLYRDH